MGGSTPVVGVVIEHHKNERAVVATDIALVVENQQQVFRSNTVVNSEPAFMRLGGVAIR